jgi:hypothetical protein
VRRSAVTALLAGIAGLLAPAISASAATATYQVPAMDKWYYPNAPDPDRGGQTQVAPVFALLGTTDEDRLGAFLLGFNTSSLITAGLGAGSYAITSVKVSVTVATPDTFLYDGTHDTYQNYLPAGDVAAIPDPDAGHPLEIFGVGLKNGYTSIAGGASGSSTTYLENSPWGTTVGPDVVRNLYPLAKSTTGGLFDASDNVSQLRDAVPFGVGTTNLSPGASVPDDQQFTFTLQLTDPDILAYLQQSLNGGFLSLLVSSLHGAAGQTGPQTYPRLYSREGAQFLGDLSLAPHLEITYAIVPEPSPTLALLLGLGVFTAGRALHRRRNFS